MRRGDADWNKGWRAAIVYNGVMYKRRDNPFPGINPYLNADLLATGWQGFHTVHVGDILKQLRAALVPLGYTAEAETGLQIRKVEPDTGETVQGTRRPDVAVFDPNPARRGQPATGTAMAPAAADTGTITDVLKVDYEEPDAYPALKVYRVEDAQRGTPVAWLELLSPTNKKSGFGLERYKRGRRDVIQADIVFVEVDYIHTLPNTLNRLPDYSHGDEDAYPYHIIVFDTRPTWQQGRYYRYPFGALTPIPTVTIPLSGEDSVDFDFGAAYRKTYEEALYGEFLDYDAPRTDVTSYRPSDQPQIRDWLAAARADDNPT